MLHAAVFPGLWTAWALGWIAASGVSSKAVRREDWASRATHGVPLLLGASLFLLPAGRLGWLGARVLPQATATGGFWAGAALLAAGLLVTAWARRALGRNWSGDVTLKVDHALVRTGPYRWVRHPIYTGLLVGVLGSAVALGQWRGMVGLGLVAIAFWRKLSIEERWLGQLFPVTYASYRARVPALIPRVW